MGRGGNVCGGYGRGDVQLIEGDRNHNYILYVYIS
jgi:hypothetical protein